MSSLQLRTARRGAAGLLVASTLLMGACSSDDKSSTSSGTTTTAPEEKVSSAADVAAGLAKMQQSVADLVAAGSDTAAAKDADEQLEPVWEDIEGTIKKNDPDTYLAIEDAMSLLSAGAKGDADQAAQGAKDFDAAVTGYLATYPA